MWLPPEFAPAYQHFTLYSGNFENSQVIQTLRRVNIDGVEWKCTEFIVVDIMGLVSSGVDEFFRRVLK